MAKQTTLWTALPNGYSEDGRSLRVSLLVSPRLEPDFDPHLGSFPDFVDWPATLAQSKLVVHFGGSQVGVAGNDFAGPLRIDEDDKGAIVSARADEPLSQADLEYACSNDVQAACAQAGALRLGNLVPKMAQELLLARKGSWLTATELANLSRHLAAWFAEDPTSTIRQIETYANYVKIELEEWNDRARIDEEHPPYDELTHTLTALLDRCRDLREVMSRFADKTDKPIITVEEGAI